MLRGRVDDDDDGGGGDDEDGEAFSALLAGPRGIWLQEEQGYEDASRSLWHA